MNDNTTETLNSFEKHSKQLYPFLEFQALDRTDKITLIVF